MTYVCLSTPRWPTDAATSAELARRALLVAPRIRLEPARGRLWADARGLPGFTIAEGALDLARSLGMLPVTVGVADTPVAALAATLIDAPITVVPPGEDRAFLAPLDLGRLDPPPASHLFPLFAGVGVENCGDLARLDHHSVEVRFGAEGVRIWRLARGDDRRQIFGVRTRELPHAELEWVDYELSSQEHVLFIVNSLFVTVCDSLAARRDGAHAMTLEFGLADRSTVALPIRCSHPTSERKTWLRVTRAVLEPVTFAASVVRIALRVDAATPLGDRQGDLFDRGFGTARVTETALAHLLDRQPDAIVTARRTRHPLPEQRVGWVAEPCAQLAERELPGGLGTATTPRLAMQLFPAPQPIEVETAVRRDHQMPVHYFDGHRRHRLTESMGPDRVSTGLGEQRVERDYFQGVRTDGTMVLLYRNLEADDWYLAGWWD